MALSPREGFAKELEKNQEKEKRTSLEAFSD
jgi:hypothetical protein